MWKYTEPSRDDYDTDEEYQRAQEAYEQALDVYVDDYIDRRREE